MEKLINDGDTRPYGGIKVELGDIVHLRDDLERGEYGDILWTESMQKGSRVVVRKVLNRGNFYIEGDPYDYEYSLEMCKPILPQKPVFKKAEGQSGIIITPESELGKSDNHCEHYASRKDKCGETIDIMERLMCHDIPEELHSIVLRNFNVAQAFKYMDRLGAKDTADKELNKAENCIHRARTGVWR